MAKITAVIDIGSNSARMAIFEKTSHFGFHLLYESKSKVRISENSYEHKGYLQNEPIQRAINALKSFLWIAKLHKARKILCVATSAVRDAPNKAILLQKAKEIGLNIKVIDGNKESYFGALAALNLLPYDSGITIDIGGGSTECALIEKHKILDTYSLDIGTIRLKELFLDKGDYQGAYRFIQEHLQKLPPHFRHSRVFGIGGSARAISKAIQKQIQYPLSTLHAFEYNFLEQKGFIQRIYNTPTQELCKLGIKEDRLDSIQSGSLIFHLVLEHFGAEKVVTSGVGVREGVFLKDLLKNKTSFPPNFNPSVRNLKDRFIRNPQLSKNAKFIASKLFISQKCFNLIPQSFAMHLNIASELCNVGVALNFYEKHRHSNYILFNALNYALTHQDRLLIAFLTQYNSKRLPNNYPYEQLLPSLEILQYLCLFVALANLLSKNPNPKDFVFTWIEDKNHLTLHIQHQNLSYILEEKLKKLLTPPNLSLKLC
ncbi:Ppx/GppA phosphatase family protein [Helicobacter mesocricetorum]|uniref:Ppx/GppA phosphatase family protein n=1 Tax=Helicobacter mesocricetorum TaxID=87012 RepID=UPI000CF18AB0|nr:Ppx/GppA phosphatase family protein [Helicobacter mesocricetorum]